MTYNEALTNKVRHALAGVANVEEKKMFRGIAFMVNGKMCITAGDNELMFRIDPILHKEAIKRDGARTMTMKGREYKGYVLVNEKSIEKKDEFDYWLNLALEFNKKIKAVKK